MLGGREIVHVLERKQAAYSHMRRATTFIETITFDELQALNKRSIKQKGLTEDVVADALRKIKNELQYALDALNQIEIEPCESKK